MNRLSPAILLSALITGFMPASTARADEPAKVVFPPEIRLYDAQGFRPSGVSIQYRLNGTTASMDGEGDVSVHPSEPSGKHKDIYCDLTFNAADRQKLFLVGGKSIPQEFCRYETYYALNKGIVYALPFGELYRVEKFVEEYGGKYASLKRVTRKELGIPGDVDYGREYAIIDWGKRGGGRREFLLKEEPVPGDPEKKQIVVNTTITVPYRGNHASAESPTKISLLVNEGDLLPSRNRGYKILRIVPHNEDKNMCGWAELDPLPSPLPTPTAHSIEK